MDYWYSAPPDDLIDPFCTERQTAYAAEWNAEYIYTPQALVNGLQILEYAATNGSAARYAVEAALARDVDVGVTVWLQSDPDDDPLELRYEVLDGPDDARLLVAVVERAIVHQVTGGENAGETLTHDNVWRAIEVVDDPDEGGLSIDLPPDAVRGECSVIAWVQDQDDLEIVGATQTHLAQ